MYRSEKGTVMLVVLIRWKAIEKIENETPSVDNTVLLGEK